MKKLFSLLAAVLFAGSMMAEVIVIDPADHDPIPSATQSTGADINITMSGIGIAYNGSLNAATSSAPADFRVFGGQTLTLSASSNISKVVIAGKANKAGWAPTVSAGTITTGASYDAVTEKATLEDPLFVVEEIGAQSITINCNKQLRVYKIQITLDGEGGGEGGEGIEYDEDADLAHIFNSYTIDDEYLAEDGDVYVEASDEDGYQVVLDIYLPEGATTLTPGTYPINDSYEASSVAAGMFSEGVYPSYAAILDAEGYITNVWYLVSGTVTVSEELNIGVVAKNSLGHDITIAIENGGEGTGVKNVAAEIKAIKSLKAGQLVIIKNGVKYNAVGAIVK
jgi:hypothetical protein